MCIKKAFQVLQPCQINVWEIWGAAQQLEHVFQTNNFYSIAVLKKHKQGPSKYYCWGNNNTVFLVVYSTFCLLKLFFTIIVVLIFFSTADGNDDYK